MPSLPSVYAEPVPLTVKPRMGIGSDPGHLAKSPSVVSKVGDKNSLGY